VRFLFFWFIGSFCQLVSINPPFGKHAAALHDIIKHISMLGCSRHPLTKSNDQPQMPLDGNASWQCLFTRESEGRHYAVAGVR
jgi:hypothetical protein